MKLYNINEDKIENVVSIRIVGVQYLVGDLTDNVLNEAGYYHIRYNQKPDSRYYTFVAQKSLIGNLYITTYSTIEKSLDTVKIRMKKALRASYEKEKLRPKINTGLGFFVYGGIDDIDELIMWKDYGETEIIDADNNVQSVTGTSYTDIASAIKNNRRTLMHKAKVKVSEINAITSVGDCILYEHEPYDSVEEITDENGTPTGEGTHIVVRYKNNITVW